MPPLDEGSFLYMPTTMPHASIGEALDRAAKRRICLFEGIPEIAAAVGQAGAGGHALWTRPPFP